MPIALQGAGGLFTRLGRIGKIAQLANVHQAALPAAYEALIAQYDGLTPPGLRDYIAATASNVQGTVQVPTASLPAFFGPNHPNVAVDLNNLAQLLQDTNRLAEAEPLMRRAMVIFIQSLGVEHPNTKTVRKNYTLLLQDMGRSEAEIERALASVIAEAQSHASPS